MTTKDLYSDMLEFFGYPESVRLRKVLECLMTPDEAALVAALPGTPQDVADKTGVDIERVTETLDKLFFKGVIFPRGDFGRREFFRFTKNMGQFHDSTMADVTIDPKTDGRELYHLWHDFLQNEMYPDKSQKLRDSTIPVWRIIPAYQSVKDLPELLPLENFHEILKAQDLIASAPCSCRYCTDGVGEPCNLHDETQEQVCLQFNRGAEYVVARGSGHALTIEEALDLADRIPKIGLIHVFANIGVMRGPTMSCQCCTDCCVDTVTADREGIPRTKSWSKSRFVAYVTQDECNGCQDCVERCPFDAIEMVKPDGSKKLKALIDPEKCYGCGVCVVGCETKALKMKCVRPPEHIVRPMEPIPAPAAKA